ncbi:hypothetical protein [Paracidovorax oryzae]|uniref:hypothetical protein n=1 Tax=Paracidovorax oryzae TaxID=862720 RepID=UPI0025855259
MPVRGAAVGATRTAWWLFAPPAALVGLRWLLQWHDDRWPGPAVWALAPFDGTRAPGAGLAFLGMGAAAVAVAGMLLRWVARRRGRQAARHAAIGAWVLACAGGAVALALRHWDARLLQPLPDASVVVAGSRPQPASLRGPGGTQVVLRWQPDTGGAAGPLLRQATLPDDPAAAWKPGQAVRLRWARGRFGGLYTTGWDAPPTGGAVPGAPHLP